MDEINVFGYYKEWQSGEFENIDISHEQVNFIKYHEPHGEGDRHYVTVFYTDGTWHRVFNPDTVRGLV